MRLAALFLLFLASALGARQKYKGAPPEALHTAILHGGGVEGVDHELKRGTLAFAAAGGSSDGVAPSSSAIAAAAQDLRSEQAAPLPTRSSGRARPAARKRFGYLACTEEESRDARVWRH